MQPDVVLVLGDRIEVFAAASAAAIGGFRVAHVHGGDRAEGVADESMRHAVSKLAHLHFAASALSRKRLRRMGEDPRWVFNTGSPAIDALRQVEASPDAPRVIVMQHPIGAAAPDEQRRMTQTLRATRGFDRCVMMPNADPGSDGIVAAIAAANVEAVDHLPRERWLSMLAGCGVLVGNSSAALIEAAALKVPCVNIGPRQGGREKPRSVIDCDYGEQNVRCALDKALKLDLRRMRHPYGDGRAGERIAELLATLPLDSVPLRKHNAY
jgi:UDP-hydrolysing UDP-N-acetyl-D-glucosamine 2-epimerase